MDKSLQQVQEFHELFEHPVGELGKESLQSRQLRVKLIFEELHELAEAGDVRRTFHDCCTNVVKNNIAESAGAITDGDDVSIIEECDAITDIQYVLNGKKLTSGFYKIADQAFDLVHANNMNKAHRSYDHCVETIKKLGHFDELNQAHTYTISRKDYPKGLPTETECFLLYSESGKLIKPHDHVKVKLATLIPLS